MSESTKYEPGQFSWVDINSKNMEEANAFYGAVFGWTCEVQDTQGGPPYSIFKLDGKQVCGMGQMSAEMIEQGIPSIWNNYVSVENCEATCARVSELGGQVIMPAMKVLEAGTMAFLQDPSGAMFAVWQPDQHAGSEVCKAPGAFCWNELATRDFDGSLKFYGDLFGWSFKEHEASPANYRVIVNGENDNGGIMQMDENWGEVPPHWTVYFMTESAEASANQVKENGGNVIHGPFAAPGVGNIAICSDPHGGMFNLIEFCEVTVDGEACEANAEQA